MKLVILDRDGTINAEREGFIQTPEDFQPLPGALNAIALLNQAGWQVVIATNMPGLGRGWLDVATLNTIQAKLHRELAIVGGRIDAMFYCPHAPDEACHCHKPQPGLFEQIGERYRVDLHQVHAVGDSVCDAQSAADAGCIPHLVLTGKSAQLDPKAVASSLPPGTRIHADLATFANTLLSEADATETSDLASPLTP